MTLAMAAWASFWVRKPALTARRRSSVSVSLPPHLGQVSLGLRSTQKRLLQTWHRWAAADADVDDVLPAAGALVAAVADGASHDLFFARQPRL